MLAGRRISDLMGLKRLLPVVLRLKTAARSGEGLVAIDDEDRAAFAVVGASSAEWTRNACIN